MSGQVLSAKDITEVPVSRYFILSAFFSHLGVSFYILGGIWFLNLFQVKANWDKTRVNPIFFFFYNWKIYLIHISIYVNI